jgi:ribosomal-protein-alanine N-acetyltransferase
MEIKIEDASIKYLDKLYELEMQCFTQEAFSKRQIAYLLTDYNAIRLIAKINSEVVGFVISQIEVEEDSVFGHIVTVNVATSFRRKGIATKLLNGTQTILKTRGIKQIRLEVRHNNSAAIKLYQHLGFKEIAKLEGYYGKEHGLYLQKNL